jgi:hypothetical protein
VALRESPFLAVVFQKPSVMKPKINHCIWYDKEQRQE